MSYLVLARKWRPQTFEEVVGQEHVTRTLQNAISMGRVAHAYLFTGPRGVGKTSSARILAKALNCAKGPTPTPCGECDSCKEVSGSGSVDVIEIDGASNNSVDDIRDLRERVMYGGARDRHKVYIIDEVHMLTNAAFNALLKTLEEPPSHVIFIFATTEAQKVPPTIISRVQRFDFRRISAREITIQLDKILKSENLPATPEALSVVARAAAGGMRDAQTLLDQVISYVSGDGAPSAITADDVLQVLGGVREDEALAALKAAMQGETAVALEWVHRLHLRGAEPRLALETLGELLRGLLLGKASPQALRHSDLLPEVQDALGALAKGLGQGRILAMLRAASESEAQMRYTQHPRLTLETLLVRLAPAANQGSLGELYDELASLEQRLRVMPNSNAGTATQVAEPTVAQPKVELAPDTATVPMAPLEIEEVSAPSMDEPLDLESVKKRWPDVIDALLASNKVLLGSALRDVELKGLVGLELSMATRNLMQHKTLETPEQRILVEAQLRATYGVALTLKVDMVAAVAPRAVAKPGGKPDAEEVEEILERYPAARRAKELFGAEIVEIRRDDTNGGK